MKSFINILFSLRLTGLLLPVIAIAIAIATFIENDFGSETARAHIYNATWFEALFIIASINLLGSMVKQGVYRKGKLTILVFHISFLLILMGAGITRYFGFTGFLHIREGDRSSLVISDETFLNVQILEGDAAFRGAKRIFLSAFAKPGRLMKVRKAGIQNIKVDYLDHITNARPVLREVPGGQPGLVLVASSPEGREYHAFYRQESRFIGGQLFQFNSQPGSGPNTGNQSETASANPDIDASAASHAGVIHLQMYGDSLFFTAPYPVVKMHMGEQSRQMLPARTPHAFLPMTLYGFGPIKLVLAEMKASAEVLAIKQENGNANGRTALSLRISTKNQDKDITVWGHQGTPGEVRQLKFGNLDILLSFGSIARTLPFSIELEDFILERYPGSDSPSSFESMVLLRDDEKNLQSSHRIYMNHILNYRGYRFYQSSYDRDEMGTVLSVNRDRTGTAITYLGYFFLSLGILLSLFNPNSRFRTLNRKLTLPGKGKAVSVLLLISALSPGNVLPAIAATDTLDYEIPVSHAREFGKMLVQDPQGRIKPMNTLSSEILRKVSRKIKLNGLTPDQVILGMLADPAYWQTVPMIRISHPGIQDLLGIDSKHARLVDFIDPELEGGYKIIEPVMMAHRKKSAERSKFDTEILRVDERNNICYMVYDMRILRVLPDVNDPGMTWHNPQSIRNVYTGDDSLFAVNITQLYLQAVKEGMVSGDWSKADEYLGYIKVFQRRMGADLIPPSAKQKAEIIYNRISLFDRLARFYLAIGLTLLIVLLVQILGRKERLKKLRRIMLIHLLAGFVVQSMGLILRWYISGHAPWSNGYEALIYISWASMLAGILFSRRTAAPIAVTAVLSWMILHTAHLSWMDPQLTNLVPVLKSYWLTIHVAIIASSYGFLGLASLLGFLNLLVMGLQSRANRDNVMSNIDSLTAIIEMTIIAGLGLLTIGTFLGGVWANESWGRYWAWDPKESWALITVLVYAFITHMRFIPGMRGIYPLNLAAVLGFSSVIMTYFGVNYYLSGMHSYAAGDPVPVPAFVYWTLAIIFLVSLTAWFRNKKMERTSA